MTPWIDLFLVTFIQALAWAIAVALVFVAAPVTLACVFLPGTRERLAKARRSKAVKS